MEPEQFDGSAGKAIQSPKGVYYTFSPNTLPVKLNYDDELINLIGQANLAIGNLAGLGHLLHDPQLFKLLVRPYMRKEAVLSSKIEGTQSSLSDVLLFEAKDDDKKTTDPDLQEVLNYISALEYGLDQIKTNAIDLDLVLRMHKRLLQNVRGESKGPGTIRTIQNWIGKSGSSLIDANYVPPAPEEVPVLMENLVSYLQAEDKTNPLVKIGLAHYQFETIHPFRDGNGRVGRLLIILYLLKTKVIPYPLLYLSAYFESRRQTYYDLLLAVSKNGKYEDWLKFFLRGVIHQSEDAVSRTRRLSDYIRACKEKTKKNRNAGNLSVVLDHLFSNPYVTVRSISEVMGKSYPTAEHTIADLVEMGILAEITGQKRSRMFLAKEIIKIIQEDPTLNPKPETKALTDR